jgi:transposase InsO family protein
VDLTLVPTAAGFWVPWLPFSILQLWPFSWRVACVVDHYSRRVMGFALFKKEPKSVDIRTFLGRVVKRHGAPKYIISDKGRQFDCSAYRRWCDEKGIDPRYAAAESIRATAVIERFFSLAEG